MTATTDPTPLDRLIRDMLCGRAPDANHAKGGFLPVHDYMALCLGHPEHGYYRSAAPIGAPIGSSGDFITAPEISQMFGELIGLWAVDGWSRMGQPDAVSLVELGPGRGVLMADALRATSSAPAFMKAIDVHLVDSSKALRKDQQRALARSGASPRWHDTVASLPTDRPMIVIANEFFDALPIHQFIFHQGVWRERVITISDDDPERLAFAAGPLTPYIDAPMITKTPDQGAIFETCPAATSVIRNLSQTIAKAGGLALIIDYGYPGPAFGDTFQAVSKHAFADPLTGAGQVDLTAHVDFSALASATTSGALSFGPVGQGRFLSALGITVRAEALKRTATARQSDDIDSALDRLIAPGQMGDIFKVMAIADGKSFSPPHPPAGFPPRQ